MNICVIGSGLSGLAAAHYLTDEPGHAVTVLEAAEEFGGRAGINQDGEHCTRLFLPDYAYLLQLLEEVPAGSGTVRGAMEQARRFARTRDGKWIEIDHIYAFLSKGLPLRDKLDISRTNRQSLFAAKRAQQEALQALVRRTGTDAVDLRDTPEELHALNVFAPVWNWSAGSMIRAMRSARSAGVTYALPGNTETHLIAPWIEHLRSRGVRFLNRARVETLAQAGDGVEVRTGETAAHYDAVVVTAFATDAFALLDRSGIARPLDHRRHTHLKCFTLQLDPREPIIADPAVKIYSHGGMTTVVQPGEQRCVTLATFPASPGQDEIVTHLREQLGLAYEPRRVQTRHNLANGEGVFVGTYVDPEALDGLLPGRVYFAGSSTDNSYAVDSGEGAARSAYAAVARMAADHDEIRLRPNHGMPPARLRRRRPAVVATHANALADEREAQRIWKAATRASALVSRAAADLRFVDRSQAAWPLAKPAVYVANHRSIFDVPIGLLTFRYLRVFPRLVVQRKYFDRPSVTGLRAIGALPALRGTDATVTGAIAAVRSGESVAFMPEGRVTARDEAPDAPHGRGAALIAASTGVPVVPIAASNTDVVWPGSRPWPIVFRPRIPVLVVIGEPIEPDGRSAAQLEEAIRRSLLALESDAQRDVERRAKGSG